MTRRFPRVARPEAFNVVPKRLVEKKFVVVAWVPVAFTKVRFWRVVEPVTSMFPPILAKVVFGSNQNSALVVEFEPMATMSSSLLE